MKIPANGFTHAGKFHADDVFATALLQILRPDIKITRGFVVPDDFDGIVYDIGFGMFDHHQEPREYRANGVPYAAFGLLWRVLGPGLVGERQAKLVRRPVGPGAVLLDGGGISEPAQRRVEARGRALDAVPCDGVKDEARQFRVRPGRFPEVDVQLPREQFQFRRAQGRQPAGRPGHPPDGGEHAGDGTPRGERQPVPQEQVGDAADDAAQERFQGRACRAERGVVREGGREQAPDPRVSEPNHGAARHGSRLPWALRCLPGKKGCA